MQVNTRVRMILPALLSAVALACAVMPAQSTSAQPERAAPSPRYITLTNAQSTAWVRNFNPFSASGLESNSGGVYEPLMIITHVSGGRTYPWLATSFKWLNGYRGLLVTLRHGVKWSDGVPFTAKDVVFTLHYGKKYAVADQNGLWASGF